MPRRLRRPSSSSQPSTTSGPVEHLGPMVINAISRSSRWKFSQPNISLFISFSSSGPLSKARRSPGHALRGPLELGLGRPRGLEDLGGAARGHGLRASGQGAGADQAGGCQRRRAQRPRGPEPLSGPWPCVCGPKMCWRRMRTIEWDKHWQSSASGPLRVFLGSQPKRFSHRFKPFPTMWHATLWIKDD